MMVNPSRGRSRCTKWKPGIIRQCNAPAVVTIAWDGANLKSQMCRACIVAEFNRVTAEGVEPTIKFKHQLRPLPGKPEIQVWKLGPLRVLFEDR